MTKLYTYDVCLTSAPHLLVGESVTVNATPMVRMAHGTIVKADGWHATVTEARRAAADKLEQLLQPVMARITKLREEVTA